MFQAVKGSLIRDARPARMIPCAPACYPSDIDYSRHMENVEVIDALSALAQTTRLDTFRLLVSREPEGVAAGELARLAGVPQNTMSTHLAILARAGLVRGERQSRLIIYRADLERFREVTLFLLKDCCGGRPDICAPLIADLIPCCRPKEAADG
jgi:ArsR family transcriptional regulator